MKKKHVHRWTIQSTGYFVCLEDKLNKSGDVVTCYAYLHITQATRILNAHERAKKRRKG